MLQYVDLCALWSYTLFKSLKDTSKKKKEKKEKANVTTF